LPAFAFWLQGAASQAIHRLLAGIKITLESKNMRSQADRRFTCFLLTSFFFTARLVHAQSRACPQEQAAEMDSGQEAKVTILNVEFPRELPLSDSIRNELEKEIRGQDITTARDTSDLERVEWVENRVDWRIQEELRNEGYFKANVHSTPYLVLAKADEQQYIVAVEAEPGAQYRLRELRFKNVSGVRPDELRHLFPLQSGDIFDASKIRDGLEAIGRVYGQLGYIDATSEPETTVDEENHVIDLAVNIDEQKQYRVEKFEVIGLDLKAAKSLESHMERGQIFNKASLEKLFEEQKSLLPTNSSLEKNAVISRDDAHATVDIVLDFRPCPHM
jgi:outer membrane protein assembly factor BamA